MKVLFTLFSIVTLVSGCAQLAALRGDSDSSAYNNQGPTTGGRWAERGLLSDDPMDGGPGRAPAGYAPPTASDQWTDPTRGQAREDENSAEPNFNNNPNLPPQTKRLYKNGSRATRADFVDDATNEGSLWGSDGQTNYYFTKNKIRGVGDIVSVVIDAGMVKDLGQEVKRTLTDSERLTELDLAQQRLAAKGATAPSTGPSGTPGTDQVSSSQAAPAASAPTGGILGNVVNDNDIDVTKSLDVKAGDTVMCEIMERYPNGNYKIRGTKKLVYKNGASRLVNLMAVVKGTDIADDDSVSSGKLYEYRLEAIR